MVSPFTAINREQDDDPLVEHEKRKPNCAYLLQKKAMSDTAPALKMEAEVSFESSSETLPQEFSLSSIRSESIQLTDQSAVEAALSVDFLNAASADGSFMSATSSFVEADTSSNFAVEHIFEQDPDPSHRQLSMSMEDYLYELVESKKNEFIKLGNTRIDVFKHESNEARKRIEASFASQQ